MIVPTSTFELPVHAALIRVGVVCKILLSFPLLERKKSMISFLAWFRRAASAAVWVAIFLGQTATGQQTPSLPWDEMDLGPFHSATFKIPELGDQVTAKGIAIKI